MNAILVATRATEHDQICDLFDVALHEGIEMRQGFASCDTEKHSLHALHLVHFDGTSDEFERAVIHERLSIRV